MLDISEITEYLFVGSQVGKEHLDELKVLKFDLMISMIGESQPVSEMYSPPFKVLWLRSYDTIFTPVPLRKLIKGVQTALPVINSGGRVLIFCALGQRRSVTMAAAVLIAKGYAAEDAMHLLHENRVAADPWMWYVHRRIKKFQRFWLENKTALLGRQGEPS